MEKQAKGCQKSRFYGKIHGENNHWKNRPAAVYCSCRPKKGQMNMTTKRIEKKRNELIQIVKMQSGTESERLKKLRELALEVGASHLSPNGNRTANEAELVSGIQTALQTASMLNACKAARKAWIVALLASLVSLLSAIAAWAAVFEWCVRQ